jgi:hypothetical protein
MTRIVGFDKRTNVVHSLGNPNLVQAVMKKMEPVTACNTPEIVLQSLPNLFKDKWSFYSKQVRLSSLKI